MIAAIQILTMLTIVVVLCVAVGCAIAWAITRFVERGRLNP